MPLPLPPDGDVLGATRVLASPDRISQLLEQSASWPVWDLPPIDRAWVELLLTGALGAIDGFVEPSDGGGLARPLYVSPTLHEAVGPGDFVMLRDAEGVRLAALRVATAGESGGRHWIAGRVEGLSLPAHPDYRELRPLPHDVRSWARSIGATHVAGAFLPQFPHVDVEATLREALSSPLAALVVFVAAGTADMLDHVRRVLVARAVTDGLRSDRVRVVLVAWPFATAPGEAGDTSVMDQIASAYGVSERLAFPPTEGDDDATLVRRLLDDGAPLPAALVSPSVAAALADSCPPRWKQGCTVFFTGLSGSGKSTIASRLRVLLMERTGRDVSFLDGDLVRKHLSSELGFSREHRVLNVLRIGYVASEITRHRGLAICAPIAPYASLRAEVRAMISAVGGFVLVHVATPLAECERRDRKGLYAKARAGLIPQFTGISDPYEAPDDAALVIDTLAETADASAERVMRYLVDEGYVRTVR